MKFETTKMLQCLWKPKTISQKKKSFWVNWKSLDFIFTFMKKRNPHQRKIHLCLWNSYLLKNAWRKRRVGGVGGRGKEKWERGRKGQCREPATRRTIWPSQYLSLKFQNALFYFLFLIKQSKCKPEAPSSIRENVLWKVCLLFFFFLVIVPNQLT